MNAAAALTIRHFLRIFQAQISAFSERGRRRADAV